MVAIPVYKEQVFLNRGTITPGGEMAILMGFLFVLAFNIVSLAWVAYLIRKSHVVRGGDVGVLALGALCVVLMFGEKVMVDEIGHEYLLGWEVVGEWIILYVFFMSLAALLIDRLKLLVKPLDQLIKRRLLRLPGAIKADSLLCLTHHDPPPCGGRLHPLTRSGNKCQRPRQASGPFRYVALDIVLNAACGILEPKRVWRDPHTWVLTAYEKVHNARHSPPQYEPIGPIPPLTGARQNHRRVIRLLNRP